MYCTLTFTTCAGTFKLFVDQMAEAQVSRLQMLSKIKTDSEDTLCVTCLYDGRVISGHESVFKVWSAMDDGNTFLHTVASSTAGEITCICQNPRDHYQLAVSVSSSVACYDTRNFSKPAQVYSYNSDEINEICYHPTGAYISACDDAGEVKIVSTDTCRLFKTLSGCHSNLCTCAKFLPRKPWEVVSGGMDCKVVRWDFSRPRPVAEVSTQSATEEVRSENMLVNPPMVHSLDTWTSNHCIACGLGNGVVAVYETRGKEITPKCMSSVHSAMVACVCCIERVENGEKKYYVVSGGNDCKIVLSQLVEKEEKTMSAKKRNFQSAKSLQSVAEKQHCSKVNWMCVDSTGNNIYVVDQTRATTVYNLF